MARCDETPRDLLFGLLALQIGMIDQEQLLGAFGAWSRAKGKTLAEILVQRGAIDSESRCLLVAMAEKQLKLHGGDAEKSIAVFANGPAVRERLAALVDDGTDMDEPIPNVGPSTEIDDPFRTASYAYGASSFESSRFRILRPHAKGGLGAVYVALDSELNREVALKEILDHHADNPVSRTRFLIEAEITGGLEHPGIVPVYGLGQHVDGRPYYAMRFIRGVSLKEAIDRFHDDETLKKDPGKRSLALRKLLRRFVDVCNAIDYAHGRGILHRDLKPANVIVGKHGETLVVDWGLAKPIGSCEVKTESDERTLMPSSSSGSAETLPGSALGTPSYMSPEQSLGDLERLGPRSDVYSLGATLYSVLTGKPPFEGPDLGEVLRDVQRGHFPRPHQVDPSIDPALEAVCLKAMLTRPEGRHASARALADDVERWVADEPTSAWVEPFSVRASRWMRRNRPTVTAVAAAVLMAFLGLAVVLWDRSRDNAALQAKNNDLDRAKAALQSKNKVLDQANAGLVEANARVHEGLARLEAKNAELDRANRLKDEAYAELVESNARVQARFDLAREAIHSIQRGVSEDDMLKGEELKDLRNKLLRSAAGFYEKLEKLLQGQADHHSRAMLAHSYSELGELIEKIGIMQEARDLHRKALAIRRDLALHPEAEAGVRLDMARSLNAIGRLAETADDYAEALYALEEARSLAEPLAQGTGATALAREVLANSHQLTGLVLWRMDDKTTETEESFRRALEIRARLVEDNPTVTQYRGSLADSYHRIGLVLARSGKMAEAMETLDRALEIRARLAEGNPAITDFRSSLAESHFIIGMMQAWAGHAAEAVESYHRAHEIRARLAADNPAVTLYQSELARSFRGIGHFNLNAGRLAEASKDLAREKALYEKLIDRNPFVPGYRSELASCLTSTAELLLRTGQTSEARQCCERALAFLEPLSHDHPETTRYRSRRAAAHLRLGQVRAAEGDPDGSAAEWKQAVELYKSVPRLNAESNFFQACCHASLAIRAVNGEAEALEAMALLRRAADLGYRDTSAYRTEPALDPLRSRSDFQLLLLDLAFLDQPFAQ
jgi:eukaryotic-like serine/threonine-protein kinase